MAASKYAAQSLNDVTGLVVVITGGGTGIGLMLARALEHNGAKVFITGRRLEKLQEAAKLATHEGGIIPLQGSTTSHEDLQRAVDQVTAATGYIDVLINNAGVSTTDGDPAARPVPLAEKSSVAEIRDYFFKHRPASAWNRTLETNVTGVFATSMAFLELLDAGNKRRAPGAPTSQIVTVGSVGGMVRFTPSFIYNASKAGVHHMMKNLGAYLVPFDIRTNIIAPGWFPSEMTSGVTKRFEPTAGVMPRDLVPLQRMGTEEEMAGTILYLTSRAGAYVNGAVLVLDGGILHNHGGV